MDLWIVLLLLGLALVGAPLFAVFGAAAMLLFSALPDTPIVGAANDFFGEKFAASPMLVTIPLFTFAGYVMAESGTPKRLVRLSRAWVGWMPGGLAIVAIGASAFFTTFTGGSGITIVALGGLLLPALMSEKYPEQFSLGLITTGGSLGLLFPPSVPIILYGVVASNSGTPVEIEKMFLAGLLPGIATMAVLAVYGGFVAKREKVERPAFDWAEARSSLWLAKWEVLLPVVLIGGMAAGWVRIHEAAAFTAIYVLFIEVFVYKDVTFTGDLPRIIREAMTLVGAILIILATAIGFTGYLIQDQVPQKILESMETIITSPVMFLIALNLFLIVVGMMMDIFSAIVVVVPLIVPIAARFGIDPYHLGIVFLLNLEIGYLTPPVGLNLFISSFRFGKPVTLLYRAVLPFIALLIVVLGVITYWPESYLWTIGGPQTPEVTEPVAPVVDESPEPDEDPDEDPDGEGLDDLGEGLDDLDGEGLDDLDGEGLDDLDGEGLDDLEDGETLDDLDEGETLDDLDEGETLDDLDEGETLDDPEDGETLDDLEDE